MLKIYMQYVLLLLSVGIASGQTNKNPDLYKRLQVGDTFKAPISIELMRGDKKNIDWEKLADKVVLLDFFETSCSICIQMLPKLQALRDKHSDIFEVIVVSRQGKDELEKFFGGNSYLKEHKVNLPVIYADNYFRELFPHKTVPTGVLLYQGKVQAITMTGYITEESIGKLYRGESVFFPLKDDFGKLALSPDGDLEVNVPKLGVRFTGYQDGVPNRSWKFEKDSTSSLYKSSLYNMSIFNALKALYHKANPSQALYIPRMDRVVWKVRDSMRYYDFEADPQWKLANYICYERFDNSLRADSVQVRIIMEDFANFYGVKIYASQEKMPVLFLRPTEVVPNKALADQHLFVYKGSAVFAGFTDFSQKFPPIVDEVKSEVEIKIYGYTSLVELNKQLAAYGIKAELGEAEIDVLIVEEVL